MPSWNEKPHTTPLINVNLKPCMPTCSVRTLPAAAALDPRAHSSTCPGAPVLIPCPIPRSVTFEVRLGECNAGCESKGAQRALKERGESHQKWCPARPIRVSCSISGETWADSNVTGVETAETFETPYPPLLERARERWALVKALVLGLPSHAAFLGETVPTFTVRTKAIELRNHRDEVFAAICDMVLAQKAHFEAHQRAVKAIGSPLFAVKDQRHYREMPVYRALEVYVDQLLEQVGVLR